jgi:SAM-dependent methyltransferase
MVTMTLDPRSRGAFKILLELYDKRPDLQEAYPEAKKGDLKRLARWAEGASTEKWHDSAHGILRPYAESYRLWLRSLDITNTAEPGWDIRLATYLKRWGPLYFSPPEEEAWVGKAQPSFLKKQGLLPEHVFLDLGCGWLRGTIELIEYLEEGNFYGIDISQANIDKAKERTMQMAKHQPNLAVASGFEIGQLWPNIQFDFVLAASVFTHLYPADLRECLRQLSKVLRGRCFATIFKDNTLPVHGGWCGVCVDHHEDHSTISRRENLEKLDFCYNTSWISHAAIQFGLRVREIGPTEIGQFMLEISPTGQVPNRDS